MTAAQTQPGLTFAAEGHTYRWNGDVVPSVTQILKAAGLVNDIGFTEESRMRGTTVHIIIELHSKGILDRDEIPEGFEGYLVAWEKFLSDTGFVPKEIEHLRYNEALGYAGTIDAVGTLYKRPTIVDVKTGSERPEYDIQTAGYAGLLRGGHRHARICVFMKENGAYFMRAHRERRDWDLFLAALNVTHWQRKHLK